MTYQRSDALGLWVPSEMRETYRLRGYSTEGRASYSNFRSFQVKTQQEIKVEEVGRGLEPQAAGRLDVAWPRSTTEVPCAAGSSRSCPCC